MIFFEKVKRRQRSDHASYTDTNMESENKTLVRLSVAVTLTFVLCVLPNQVVCFLMEFDDFEHMEHSIEVMGLYMGTVNKKY